MIFIAKKNWRAKIPQVPLTLSTLMVTLSGDLISEACHRFPLGTHNGTYPPFVSNQSDNTWSLLIQMGFLGELIKNEEMPKDPLIASRKAHGAY